MTDLRQAAQAVLERWDSPLWKTGTTAAAIADLRTALEQPEQEPTCPECKAAVLYECVACSSNNYPPAAQPEQVVDCPRCGHVCSQREWVGLEAEDLAQIDTDEFWQTGNHMAIALAVENKLKELNNG